MVTRLWSAATVHHPRLLSAGMVVVSAALWFAGLGGIDLDAINDLGLVSVLPAETVAGLVLLSISFMFAQWRRLGDRVALGHVVVLIVLLFGIPPMVEVAPRFNVAWRHVGITDVLLRTGEIDPTIDAYFSWPGFFTLSALLTEVAGLASPLDVVSWAPVAFNLLYLPPLLLIFRGASQDSAVVWFAAWVFFVTNWIGQDYYSPQAYGYFVYVLIIGLLMRYYAAEARPMWPLPRGLFTAPITMNRVQLSPTQRAGLLALILVMFAALVASHQLSPFALLGSVIILALIGRITVTGLPAAFTVVLGTWLSYMTVTYLSGHLADMVARIGSVDSTVAANLTDRFRGSPGHVAVLVARSMFSVALWSLAGVGAVRLLLARRVDLTLPVLAAAPFTLILLQTYGGEMLLRVYLFALPFMSVLASIAVLGASRARSWRRYAAGLAIGLVFVAGFLVARYGNERMDMVTGDEIAGMQRLYDLAPLDAQLVAAHDNTFWKFRDYELYHYDVVTEQVLEGDVASIVGVMEERPGTPGFLVLSRAQFAALQLSHSMEASAWDDLKVRLSDRPRVEVVFENPDVTIFSTKAKE